jgi:predicted RNase H-like HicB family nuclease
MLKPQDIVILLKIAAMGETPWRYDSLAKELYMSASEVHAGFKPTWPMGKASNLFSRPLKNSLLTGFGAYLPGTLKGGRLKKIPQVRPPFPFDAYTRILSPIADEDGGGFLMTFPDLPGCMSDGATEKEALVNGKDAFLSWVAARVDQGKIIPPPKTKPVEFVDADASGKYEKDVQKHRSDA